MYHYHFKFPIFSASSEIEEKLIQHPSSENILFDFITFPITQFSTFNFDPYLFLLLDFSSPITFNEHFNLLEQCRLLRSNSINRNIILCADHTLLNQLSPSLLSVFTDIWIAPFNNHLIEFYYSNLVKRIQLEKDYWMVQNYLDTTIDSIPDLVWYKDKKGKHVKVNNSFGKAVGKTKADCEGRGHYYIWDLKEEEYALGEYVYLETEEIVMREKRTCLFDEKVKSKEGMRQFKTYKSPVFDEFGELVGTLGIAHDVTDFGNISTELEIILDSLPFAGLLCDIDYKIVNINEKFLEYFEINKVDVLNSDYPIFRKKILGLSSFNKPEKNMELNLKSKENTLILEIQETVIFDIFHQPVGYFCIYRDITEHKKHLDLMEHYQKNLENDVRKQVQLNQFFQKNMLIAFADMISSRDSITGGHIKRTSYYVDLIINMMKKEDSYKSLIDPSFIDHMYLSAPLHDIGKVSIPDTILFKPGKYLPEEYEIMKQHTVLGSDILDNIMNELDDSEYYDLSKKMAKYHHERWDGSGYPEGLKEKQIPLCARIMAVADVFDALTSERPYKTAFTLEKARQIIEESSGTHFDPDIIDIFLKNFNEIEEAAKKLNKLT